MAIKLAVLYPHPIDKDEFERSYLGKHVPTMHGFNVTTLHTIDTPPPLTADGKPPYYRIALIDFRDMQHVREFMGSEQAKVALASAVKISTGGPPLLALCQPDA